jgi:hypothetical protein
MGQRIDPPTYPASTLPSSAWASDSKAWSLDGFDPVLRTVPGPCVINCTNDQELYSFHREGVNGLLGDGSVRFLHGSVRPAVLAALITRSGAELISNTEY